MSKKKLPHIIDQIRTTILNTNQWIDYKKNKVISFSQSQSYNGCKKKWALQYVDGHKTFKENIHTIFGSAIHEAIQKYLDILYNQSVKEVNNFDIINFFKERFVETYKKSVLKNKDEHFSTPEELREFYEDGELILNTFISKRGKYFTKKGWYLVGCELPLIVIPNPNLPKVVFKGSIDIVLYHEPTNSFEIIDIKTSTSGWREKDKKDKDKTSQLVIYKYFFSILFNIPLKNIKVLFFIVKRKIPEDTDFPISRIQTFEPSSGKTTVNQTRQNLLQFINEVFDEDGYKSQIYKPDPSKWNCRFCPFAANEELCGLGKKFI